MEKGDLSASERSRANDLVGTLKKALARGALQGHVAERTFQELAVRLSVLERDWTAMERHIQQLLPLYAQDTLSGSQSPSRDLLIGLNLMRLLAQNRLAEYHMELEVLSAVEPRRNPYVSFPFQVEQALVEGSYEKILHIEAGPEWQPFIELLQETTRREMVTCWAEAYTRATLVELATMAALPPSKVPALLERVLDPMQYQLEGEMVTFRPSALIQESPSQHPVATESIDRSMEYIRALERIV
jgi:26S proteasome regulatory subunit N12